ncbi:MAG: RagB/SusD family nutrient uptake outer membrane protein [Marinilabiliaceae bacterium]|nr:RagB/SusD family nutrient uptake outer membrane protein [Marinilabiliaceae bacterium]
MKKLVLITLISILFFSCDDKLEVEITDFVNTDGLFENDPKTLADAANALYAEWYDRGRNIEYYACFEHLGTDLASVNLYNIDHVDRYDIFNSYDASLNPSFYSLERLYNFEYRIINEALRIIHFGETSEAVKDDAEVKRAVAEAKFFYSFAYYELFMTFGNVPLIKSPINGPKDDFERTPVEEIIPYLEIKLLEAIVNLDENSTTARVSANACRMLLAKIYMAAGGDVYQESREIAGAGSVYWQKAEKMAEDVIASGVFSLVKEKRGPFAMDADTVKGGLDWSVAAYEKMRDGMQQKYMVRHPNYFSSLFQNRFEGPEDGNTETIFRIAFQGSKDDYGRNYMRCVWVPYSQRANGLVRDFYQGGRSWGRAKPTDYMSYDIWDYEDNVRKQNYDARKYGSLFYEYYFNDEKALANHYLYIRRFSNPNVAVDTLFGWKAVDATVGVISKQGKSGSIIKNYQINWGNDGDKYFTADMLVVEDDSVFVQPIITDYPGKQLSAKWNKAYTDMWFSKRVYYKGDTIWGPRPGDEYFPRQLTDWQSVYVGCRKHSYWVRNSSSTAASQAEVKSFVNVTGGPGDLIIFRFAEAYLIAGEAEFHQNKLQEAADHFNEVRKRAFNNGNVPVKWRVEPGELSIDWILDERGRELFVEEYRWFEIKRLNKWDRVIENNTFAASNFVYKKHRLRPIPIRVIDSNKGNPAGMYQNSEY